ncbi:MAG: 30S ribosome-binding factor RbfA [Motilibacteraceae bacterium]
MADAARARKLADRIRVIVAEMLETRVKDPRLGFITITDVRVTGDLQQATVFYTVYGDEAARADTAAALESAKGVLRSEVGRQTGVRHTPSLAFVADAIPDTAQHIEDLLRQAAASDAEVARAASGAAYAGEADPYRAPRLEDADDDDDAEDGEVDLSDNASGSEPGRARSELAGDDATRA